MEHCTPAAATALACSAFVLLAAAALAGSGSDCEQRPCNAAEQPHDGAKIDRGIAGVIALQSDNCVNDCCACKYSDTELRVWRAQKPVTSRAEAASLVTQGAPMLVVAARHDYEQALADGDYLVCREDVCAAVHVGSKDVFTVNVQLVYGPARLIVFAPGSGEQRDDLVLRTGREST